MYLFRNLLLKCSGVELGCINPHCCMQNTNLPRVLPNAFVFPQENADQCVLPGLQRMCCGCQVPRDLVQCPSPKESYTSHDPSQPWHSQVAKQWHVFFPETGVISCSCVHQIVPCRCFSSSIYFSFQLIYKAPNQVIPSVKPKGPG